MIGTTCFSHVEGDDVTILTKYQLVSRTPNSLKSAFGNLHRNVNHFAGLTSQYPKKSGEKEKDKDQLYWNRILTIFAERFPTEKNPEKYMPAYKWLRDQPKYSDHFKTSSTSHQGADGEVVHTGATSTSVR